MVARTDVARLTGLAGSWSRPFPSTCALFGADASLDFAGLIIMEPLVWLLMGKTG